MKTEFEQLTQIYFDTDRRTEFSTETPNPETAEMQIDALVSNIQFWLTNADDFGINGEFFMKFYEDNPVITGPFISPAPLPTTFAGNPDNIADAVDNTTLLCKAAEKFQMKITPYLLIILTTTDVPKGGQSMSDCLLLPKNKQGENKRSKLVSNVRINQPYNTLLISRDDIERVSKEIRDSLSVYVEKNPEARRRVKGETVARQIEMAIRQDLDLAFQQCSRDETTTSYLQFATKLNRLILNRTNPSFPDTVFAVDERYYTPFLRNGIKDIRLFIYKLQEFGFFKSQPGFVKTVSDGSTEIFKISQVTYNDIILQSNNRTVTYSELRQTPIVPCKELAYFLCFSSLVPVIYGSQNCGGFYEPYAQAKELVQKIGCSPVFYRVQQQIPADIQRQQTAFDFYNRILFKNI